MLYIGAIEGSDRYLAPKHVYRMTDQQARQADIDTRLDYGERALKPGFHAPGERWYADNTREPIRDETLREGLVAVGAVHQRKDLPTTSSRPRYALKPDFAALFDPSLTGDDLESALADWRENNLSKGALTRIAIRQSGATASRDGVMVRFPNGETRQLAPGPSSFISQAVIEAFAPNFLVDPAVLWLSESGNKVVTRDDDLASSIGITIEADRNLPDIILADLGDDEPLIIFVEVVATDGPVSERRKAALLELTDKAGFPRNQVAFLTAYADRSAGAFKKTVGNLAWGSFAWFASEPKNLVVYRGEEAKARGIGELL
jgi:hypothetical protein